MRRLGLDLRVRLGSPPRFRFRFRLRLRFRGGFRAGVRRDPGGVLVDQRALRPGRPVDRALRDRVGQFGEDLVRCGAHGRLFGQAAADEVAPLRRDGGQVGFLCQHAVQDRGEVTGPEGRVAGGGEVQHAAQREHVARGADLPAVDLFRRHVGGCADEPAGRLGAVRRPHDPEVDHPGPVLGEQDVGRLEVPVDQPGRMNGLERLRERRRQRGDRPPGQGPARGVDDGGRIEAADRSGGLDLAPEAPQEAGGVGEVSVDDLYRDEPSPGRTCQVDEAHTARAEPGQQLVGGDAGGIRRR